MKSKYYYNNRPKAIQLKLKYIFVFLNFVFYVLDIGLIIVSLYRLKNGYVVMLETRNYESLVY